MVLDTKNVKKKELAKPEPKHGGYLEVPSPSKAQAIVMQTKRKVSELPALPKQMNTLSAVLSYKLWGLADSEIAIALGLSEKQVVRLQTQDAYLQLQEDILERVRKADSDVIRAGVHENALKAVRRQAELLDSEDEKVAASMVKDALDRDGYRPADVVEHRHTMQGGLAIEIIHSHSGEGSIPELEVDVEDATLVEEATQL